LIRYLIGDRGEFADCACGRSGPAIRVDGRIAPSVTVHGRPVLAQELVNLALETADVVEAQVAMVTTEAGEERLELRVRLADGVPPDEYTLEWIKYQALSGHVALDPGSADHAETFDVVAVDRLSDDAGQGEPALSTAAEE
jgi:phenylacetate-CoA ligase